MASSQLNVRIDEKERASGDEALASIGYSPSQVVQSVWRFAAQNRHNKTALRRLSSLLEESHENDESEKERRLRAHETGHHIYSDALEAMGITGTPKPPDLSDDELLYQAYLDRMQEKGLSV